MMDGGVPGVLGSKSPYKDFMMGVTAKGVV